MTKNKIYGYIRVSSTDQNEERQLVAMRAAQVPEKNVYMDKQSARILTARSTKAYQKTEAGRPALHFEHRPAGTQL